MGYITIFFCIVVTLTVTMTVTDAANGRCPPPSKVYGCTPRCHEDYECKYGKICCPNSCNTKSCSEPAPYSSSTGSKYGGPGVYCDGVKCKPNEVCKPNRITKRLRCQHP
ncbi:antileukoproteinase-like [Galleria mellonella]|uniref:Antileukoproteinase-like n=1 Tax=Galleria mellonella TaxID=7137 RepID=A0A6J1WJ12_GALME|nr:antileukoproteinase-like [Galleria mellonella]